MRTGAAWLSHAISIAAPLLIAGVSLRAVVHVHSAMAARAPFWRLLIAWSEGASNAPWILGVALAGLGSALWRRSPERARLVFIGAVIGSFAELMLCLPTPLHENAWFDYRVFQLIEVASAVFTVATCTALLQTALLLARRRAPT